MDTTTDNKQQRYVSEDHERSIYLKWRRQLISDMIDCKNTSSCLNVISKAIKKIRPMSIDVAVSSVMTGPTIGEQINQPTMESDGTPLDEG